MIETCMQAFIAIYHSSHFCYTGMLVISSDASERSGVNALL